MGVPGVPFKVTESEIAEAIVKYKGIMKKVGQHFDVCPDTMYIHFHKYPALKPLLDEIRAGRKERMLDSAEDVLEHAMENCKESDLTNALKAAQFFLINRGKDRGFTPHAEKDKEEHTEAVSAIKELASALRPQAVDPS